MGSYGIFRKIQKHKSGKAKLNVFSNQGIANWQFEYLILFPLYDNNPDFNFFS
jgi:hypothetical protein